MFRAYRKDRCYVIAEIGCLFTTFEEARALIDAAASCGVDAVKLQTFRADTVASRAAMFDMENTGVVNQHDLFKKFEVGEELHRRVFDHARARGLDWFSTPSHETDVELLEKLGVGVHKIGSDDAVNLPFLRSVARTGKPIILSTGMCTLAEVRESVRVVLEAGAPKLVLLHCVTSYPTHPEHVNLRAMTTLMREFPGLDVGYSDHSLGPLACIAAVAMGARVVEKHFTLDKNGPEPDARLSADPAELRYMVESIRAVETMLGSGVKEPAASEATTRVKNRKSVVTARAVQAGEPLARESLAIKRPGHGIAPADLDRVVGRIAARDLRQDEVLTWDDLR